MADEATTARRPASTKANASFNADCMDLRSGHTCNSGCIFLETFLPSPSSTGIRDTKFALHLSLPRKTVRTNRQPREEMDSLPASGWERRRAVWGSLKHIRRYPCPTVVLDREARSDFAPALLSGRLDR